METIAVKTYAGLAALLLLAGCNTPYPNRSPIYGAEVTANPHRRGTPEFCRTYARQTAGNDYEANSDDRDSIGADLITAQQARMRGEAAYQRCLSGRTG